MLAWSLIPQGIPDTTLFLIVGSLSDMVFGMSKTGFGSGISILAVPMMIYACSHKAALAVGIMLPILIVADYVAAARRAKEAGFDGIEVHSANGYLLDQFLQSRSNHRDDAYGGSLDHRFRFFGEILQAVLEVWAPEQVGARISPNGVFNDMGCDDFREAFLYFAEQINALGLGYLHVMDGLAFGFHEKGEPMTLKEFRPIFDGVLMGNCGYTKETAEARMAEGDADMIAIGRPFITNPDLVERFKDDRPLAPCEDMSLWYCPGEKGYTDYKSYKAG